MDLWVSCKLEFWTLFSHQSWVVIFDQFFFSQNLRAHKLSTFVITLLHPQTSWPQYLYPVPIKKFYLLNSSRHWRKMDPWVSCMLEFWSFFPHQSWVVIFDQFFFFQNLRELILSNCVITLLHPQTSWPQFLYPVPIKTIYLLNYRLHWRKMDVWVSSMIECCSLFSPWILSSYF